MKTVKNSSPKTATANVEISTAELRKVAKSEGCLSSADLKAIDDLRKYAAMIPGGKTPSLEEACAYLKLDKNMLDASIREYSETRRADRAIQVIRERIQADTELLKALKALFKSEDKTGMAIRMNLNSAYQIEVHASPRDLYITKMEGGCEPSKLVSMKTPSGTILDAILQGE